MALYCRGHNPPATGSNRTAKLSLSTPQDVLQWHYPGPNGNSGTAAAILEITVVTPIRPLRFQRLRFDLNDSINKLQLVISPLSDKFLPASASDYLLSSSVVPSESADQLCSVLAAVIFASAAYSYSTSEG
jgi:hypothetical protein